MLNVNKDNTREGLVDYSKISQHCWSENRAMNWNDY